MTLLNCLSAAIPPRERVISCEEVFELQIGLPDWIALQTRQPNLEGQGEVRQRRLIKEALRMRPDRIIVGEVRQEECLDLLLALNAGLPGMTSIHANSAREALVKLTTLPLLAGGNVTVDFILPTVASSVALVVYLGRDAYGRRRIEEILGVTGRVEEGRVEAGSIFRLVDGYLSWTGEFPPHPSKFEAMGCDLRELLGNPQRGSMDATTFGFHGPGGPWPKSGPLGDVGPWAAGGRRPGAHRWSGARLRPVPDADLESALESPSDARGPSDESSTLRAGADHGPGSGPGSPAEPHVPSGSPDTEILHPRPPAGGSGMDSSSPPRPKADGRGPDHPVSAPRPDPRSADPEPDDPGRGTP